MQEILRPATARQKQQETKKQCAGDSSYLCRMAGIYLHIPFCRQACHYCNFHFSTSINRVNDFIPALLREMELRRDYIGEETVATVYFGGGTPSLLDTGALTLILD